MICNYHNIKKITRLYREKKHTYKTLLYITIHIWQEQLNSNIRLLHTLFWLMRIFDFLTPSSFLNQHQIPRITIPNEDLVKTASMYVLVTLVMHIQDSLSQFNRPHTWIPYFHFATSLILIPPFTLWSRVFVCSFAILRGYPWPMRYKLYYAKRSMKSTFESIVNSSKHGWHEWNCEHL